MRKQLLGVVLPLVILVMMTAAAQTQNTGTATTEHAALQRLNVVRGDGTISVEFSARGAVAPRLSTMSSPARVVIDLPNTVAVTDQHQIAIDSDGVKGVRVGMNGQTPPSTRVVVDLDKACKVELVPGSDNKFAVKLYPGVAAVKASAKPASKTAAARRRRRCGPGGGKLTTVSMVTTPALPEKDPGRREEGCSGRPARSCAAPVQTASKPATDYVFVEPSYKPKDETKTEDKPAPVEPAGAHWKQRRSSPTSRRPNSSR